MLFDPAFVNQNKTRYFISFKEALSWPRAGNTSWMCSHKVAITDFKGLSPSKLPKWKQTSLPSNVIFKGKAAILAAGMVQAQRIQSKASILVSTSFSDLVPRQVREMGHCTPLLQGSGPWLPQQRWSPHKAQTRTANLSCTLLWRWRSSFIIVSTFFLTHVCLSIYTKAFSTNIFSESILELIVSWSYHQTPS